MSGMDDININSLVDSAMRYDKIPLYRYQDTKAIQAKQLSVFGSLKGLFADFQLKLSDLSAAFKTPAFLIASTDSTVADASVLANSLVSGSHNIVVTQLAESQSFQADNFYASKTDALGFDETLQFTNSLDSSKTVSITLTASDTLATIQSKINAQADELGISANIVSSTDGSGNPQYIMRLTANTGVANEFSISSDAGTSGFANFTQTASGKDALFTFDGFNEVRSENAVSDVMDGLKLNLKKIGSTTITLTDEGSARKEKVQTAMDAMLKSYNTVIEYLDTNQFVKLKPKDADGKESDYFVSTRNDVFANIKQGLRNVMTGFIAADGNITSLDELGLKGSSPKKLQDPYDDKGLIPSSGDIEIDHTLTLSAWNDKNRYSYNLDDNFDSVESFLNSKDGLIKKLNTFVDDNINDNMNSSLYFNATEQINRSSALTDKRINEENDKLVIKRNQLYVLYSKLTSIMDKYDNISKSLDGLVLNLNNVNKSE